MPTTLTPYLSFDGNDARGLRASTSRPSARKIQAMMSYADMPPSARRRDGCATAAPPSGDRIMHACLALPGGGCCSPATAAGQPYEASRA